MPAKNEERSVGQLVEQIYQLLPDCEVIVVDDGSTDDTKACAERAGATVIKHDVSLGNGAAIKNGVRSATGEIYVFLDADGQHHPADIPKLLRHLQGTCKLVVGARSRKQHASLGRMFANSAYNKLASMVSGQSIKDLTSGFRVARAKDFEDFLPLLPNGFSYPTTSTMAFLRSGYGVRYVDIDIRPRAQDSSSHIRPLRDGVRFLLIIFKITVLYSPLKLFFPLSLATAFLTAIYSTFTYLHFGDLTTVTGSLGASTTLLIFLIGLVSEQITALTYMNTHHKDS